MKKSLFLLLILFFPFSNQGQNEALQEMLVLFTQPEDDHFRTTTLPWLREWTQEQGILFIEKAAGDGLPATVTSTPAIVYQNYRGRSVYASRYTERSTIKNFVRTSRAVPQRVAEYRKKDVLVRQAGRTLIAAPLKVTDLQGNPPGGLTSEGFRDLVIRLFAEKMPGFERRPEVVLQKSDRQFYIDLHPYFAKDGAVYLSLELYSQFSCQDPVLSRLTDPLRGRSDQLESLLAEAAEFLARAIDRQARTSVIGDAFTPVPDAAPVRDWPALGLALPEPPPGQSYDVADDLRLPDQWQFYQAADPATPVVQFRFMEPLDRYAGEVREIDGKMTIGADGQRLTGAFTAAMQSLTMGMESFDENVLNKYIKAFKFPTSSFRFDAPVDLSALSFGETIRVSVPGAFQLMRRTRPVEVDVQLTPIVNDAGAPLLRVQASFGMNIVDDFRIKGPDGPDPARKTLLFNLNFLMQSVN